jgi:hypothetical protein
VSCAKSTGYEVAKPDLNLVRVTKPGGGFVNVEQMPSHSEAVKAAKAADLIQSRVVGRLWMKSYPATDEGLRTDIETCVLTGSPN